MAQDWFDQIAAPAQPAQQPTVAPASPPGVIYGRPKAPDPYQVQKDRFSQDMQIRSDQRAADDQVAQAEQRRRAQLEWNATHKPDGTPIPNDGKPTEAQQKIATLLTRIKGGFGDIQATTTRDPSSQRPGFIESVRGGLAPDGLLGAPVRALAGADRRIVHDSQTDVLDALLTLGTGAAYNREQLQGQTVSYFPQYNDTEEEIAVKNQRMSRLIEAAKVNAGPQWAEVESAIAPYLSQIAPKPPEQPAPTSDARPVTREQSIALWGSELYDANGNPLGPDGGPSFDAQGNPQGLAASVTDTTSADKRDAEIDAEIKRREAMPSGGVGASDLIVQGGTFGLSDEIVGAGSAIARALTGKDGNYAFERDLYRRQLDQARDRMGLLGTGAEIGGAILTGRPGAISALVPQTLRESVVSGARIGAGTGALAGFGYGEGLQGSATNALLGGALGAGIGAGVSAIGPGVNALRGRLPSRVAPDLGISATPAEVAAAGQAEGVTVNRAMVDPASRNRAIGVESTMAGGPIVQRGMNATARQIEGRAAELGRGGTAMQDNVAGQAVEGAARRFISTSGKAIGRIYDRAAQGAQGVTIQPAKATGAVDDAIARLSQTPETNKAEIAYLEGLKSDLSKPLGVETLRDLRTTLRQKISKGELIFGQNEARVKGIMDELSADIEGGLRSAGRGAAADSFRQADDLYRQRADFIEGTVQKLIGKRNANLPPEKIIANFRAMASPRGDEAGLAKMMRTMTPEERSDIAATFADALGKNNNGEFTTAQFAAQAEKLPEAARRHLFGDEGAQSIKNLITLSKAHKAVPRNTSGTGASNDYRSWIANLFLGGGTGFMTGSGTTAIATAAGATAVKTGRDILSARALMSPKITKWLANSPATTNSRAIDAHFQRLSLIAAQEPALAGDIQVIQQRIMDAAKNGSLQPAAAQNENERRPPQP